MPHTDAHLCPHDRGLRRREGGTGLVHMDMPVLIRVSEPQKMVSLELPQKLLSQRPKAKGGHLGLPSGLCTLRLWILGNAHPLSGPWLPHPCKELFELYHPLYLGAP